MTETLQWPTRGDFGRKTLLGPFHGDVSTMLDKRGFFGLEPEATFLYGCLRDAEGEIYEICRRIPALAGHEGWNQMFLLSTVGNDCLRMDLDVLAGNATSENCVIEERDGVARWASRPDATGHPFEITWSDGHCTWEEDDTWTLAGDLIGPGLQWYSAGPDTSLFYVSHLYQVQGTLLGKPVRGMVGFDQTYMPEGGMLYFKHDVLTGEKLHQTWYIWATRYKDGSVEGGHFMLGHDQFGFALLTNQDQQITATTNIEGVITPGPDQNFPAGIELTVDGQEWEFLPDPKGPMPDLLGKAQPSTPQNEGRWRRKGDTREPDVWFAWGEIAPSHGLTPSQRTRR